MGLFQLLIFIAGVGVFAWAVTTYIPMSEVIKRIIQIVAVVVVVWIVLSAFGLLPHDVPVPRFN